MPVDRKPLSLNDLVIQRVRAEMAAQRVSQTALGQTLGWTQNYVSYRLTGKTAFDLDEIEAIAAALDMSIERLLFAESPAQRQRRAS